MGEAKLEQDEEIAVDDVAFERDRHSHQDWSESLHNLNLYLCDQARKAGLLNLPNCEGYNVLQSVLVPSSMIFLGDEMVSVLPKEHFSGGQDSRLLLCCQGRRWPKFF